MLALSLAPFAVESFHVVKHTYVRINMQRRFAAVSCSRRAPLVSLPTRPHRDPTMRTTGTTPLRQLCPAMDPRRCVASDGTRRALH